MLHLLSDVLKETGMITAFVLIIMLFIEVLNIATQGSWAKVLARSPFWQIVIAALLGTLPGCFGGFAAVSMYTHGIIHFGALMAAMISNIGDEAFVMLVQMPKDTLYIMSILLALSILIGWLTWRLGRKAPQHSHEHAHFEIHHDDFLPLSEMAKHWKQHLKHMSFARALLLIGISSFIVMLLLGNFEHSHHAEILSQAETHHHSWHLLLQERWFNLIFLFLACLVLITLIVVNDHFLEHHLWGHVIKHHFLKIFLWVFAALMVIHLINHREMEMAPFLNNKYLMLLLAILIGLIPQSGPHLIFVSLFLSGHIPFAILLANAIVQDGHSALPLFAESKKAFLTVKISKALVAALIGLISFI